MTERGTQQPIYLRVADVLQGEFVRRKPGALLPSENELARTYGVSRLTARAALEELERRYLVRRSQGRRAFVARRIDYTIGPGVPPSWSETVRRGGAEPRSETMTLQHRRSSDRVRTQLRLPPGGTALFLARRRFVDDELAAYAETWLAGDLVPDLSATLTAQGSLYAAFAAAYALRPVRAASRAELVIAPASVARKLEVDGRPMLFRLDGQTDSGRERRPIEMTTSWLRADVFRVVFALERET